jgi:serine/threonine protein kinase
LEYCAGGIKSNLITNSSQFFIWLCEDIISHFDWLGSLDKLLFDSNVKVSEEHKIRLVRGIAAGLLHLHKHNIIHRDLAARNILLTGSGDPKISVYHITHTNAIW